MSVYPAQFRAITNEKDLAMSDINVSAVALSFYRQADFSEVYAIAAYAFDTITFKKDDYHAYNTLLAEKFGLAIKTMQNRSTVARAIRSKYGSRIAGTSGVTVENVIDFANFLQDEMKLAHTSFVFNSADISNFLAGRKPASVQRQEQKAEEEAIKEALKKKAEEALKRNQADMSGSPEQLTKGETVEPSTPIGEPAPAPAPAPAPVPDPKPLPEHQHKEGTAVLLNATIDADGNVHVTVFEQCDLGTLDSIIESLRAKAEEMAEEIRKAA